MTGVRALQAGESMSSQPVSRLTDPSLANLR